MNYLKHSICGSLLTIACLVDDVAMYVYCNHCNDIVEDGEILGIKGDINTQFKLRIVKEDD